MKSGILYENLAISLPIHSHKSVSEVAAKIKTLKEADESMRFLRKICGDKLKDLDYTTDPKVITLGILAVLSDLQGQIDAIKSQSGTG